MLSEVCAGDVTLTVPAQVQKHLEVSFKAIFLPMLTVTPPGVQGVIKVLDRFVSPILLVSNFFTVPSGSDLLLCCHMGPDFYD